MSGKQRRFPAEEKVRGLRRHLVDKVAGRAEVIRAERARELEAAREERKRRPAAQFPFRIQIFSRCSSAPREKFYPARLNPL